MAIQSYGVGVLYTIRDMSVGVPRGRQRAILAYEISWFFSDFPVISLKNDVICCKSGWGWRVGLISELDFKEICFDFSWFQLDFNWFLHEVYEISFVADPSWSTQDRIQSIPAIYLSFMQWPPFHTATAHSCSDLPLQQLAIVPLPQGSCPTASLFGGFPQTEPPAPLEGLSLLCPWSCGWGSPWTASSTPGHHAPHRQTWGPSQHTSQETPVSLLCRPTRLMCDTSL